jgi:tRNA(His) 5'-end guanylyltransferase
MDYLMTETQALIGYTQSDEITLMWHVTADSRNDYMFSGKLSKLNSVLAGMASAYFMRAVTAAIPEKACLLPTFDCRVWQVPNLGTAAQVFLWRQMDATKNAISMAAQAVFSPKQLHKLHGQEMIELLQKEKGIDWHAYPHAFKYGTLKQRSVVEMQLPEAKRVMIPETKRPPPETLYQRTILADKAELLPLTHHMGDLMLPYLFPTTVVTSTSTEEDAVDNQPISSAS